MAVHNPLRRLENSLRRWLKKRETVERAVRATVEPLERRTLLSVNVTAVPNAPDPSNPRMNEGRTKGDANL